MVTEARAPTVELYGAHTASAAPAATEAAQRHIDIPAFRRMMYFWMAIVAVLLVGGCIGASSDHPAIWQSWRGPAMVALAVAFAGWYVSLFALRRVTRPRSERIWPPPRAFAYPYLAAGFAITGLLLWFDDGFIVLAYALVGVCVGMLRTRETYLPVGLIVLLFGWAQNILPIPTHGNTWADTLGGLFSIGLGVGISYSLAALSGQRFYLERTLAELREAHRRLRLSAAREADVATLRERNRLAREMHDSLGHALVSISIKLEATQRLYAVDAGRANAEMDETKALVRSTMTELRNSLAGLRPAALEEQALGCALAEMAREMERRTGVAASCTVDEQAALLNRETQETLYRVAQEALTNVAKHAHARHVWLTLALQRNDAVLEVADDGVGLGAAERDGIGRYGVMGMRERVEALGGMITLGPRPEGGTLLRAWAPAPGMA